MTEKELELLEEVWPLVKKLLYEYKNLKAREELRDLSHEFVKKIMLDRGRQ